jgi:CheY-like chemotaxis protein
LPKLQPERPPSSALATVPDVVLMDIRMPELDGIEATPRILSHDVTREVRVLILTTFDLDEYVHDALPAGASGFLLKDTPPEQLGAAGPHRPSDLITRRARLRDRHHHTGCNLSRRHFAPGSSLATA